MPELSPGKGDVFWKRTDLKSKGCSSGWEGRRWLRLNRQRHFNPN